jgi:hypothetical protein
MMLDLLGAVELTACAAVGVAVFSIEFGRDVATRLRLAVALGTWFVLVVSLAATRALHYEHALGSPGVGLAVFVPFVALWVSLLRVPALRRGLMEASVPMLVALHVARLLGANFVLLYSAGRLPAPFAPIAGWGDILVGAAAVPVAWLVARGAAGWRSALLAWNVVGLVDLTTAIVLGVLSSPGPLRVFRGQPGTGDMSTLPWMLIPAFLVPLLAVTHLAIFHRVWRTREQGGASPAGVKLAV